LSDKDYDKLVEPVDRYAIVNEVLREVADLKLEVKTN